MRFIYTFIFLSIFHANNAQTIERFSIDSGGTSATVGGINILYTIGAVSYTHLTLPTILLV